MDASKVTVSPQYLRLERMGRNKRASLRRQNVLDLIRSKPAGTPITLAEFQAVCSYDTTAAAYGLLKTMINRGTIVREQEGLNRHSYVVAADAVKARGKNSQPAPAPSTDIEALAKEFVWTQNSDSLREFIKWAKVEAFDSITKRSND